MLTRANGAPILTPEQVYDLIVRPALAAAVCSSPAISTVVPIAGADLRVPVVAADPQARWTAEGAEIVPSDATLTEVTVRPAAVKGLSIVSNELANDSSPAAVQVVGDGLVRDTARRLDEAFWAGLSSPAPAGISTLTGVQPVDAGAAWVNSDPFAEAASLAETEGATLTGWAAHPSTVLALARLKAGEGSNVPLLAPGGDAAQPSRRLLEGLPLLVSAYVAAGIVYGVDATRVLTVVREDAEVVADPSPFFTSDRTAIRSVMRAAWAFPHPASIVKITLDA